MLRKASFDRMPGLRLFTDGELGVTEDANVRGGGFSRLLFLLAALTLPLFLCPYPVMALDDLTVKVGKLVEGEYFGLQTDRGDLPIAHADSKVKFDQKAMEQLGSALESLKGQTVKVFLDSGLVVGVELPDGKGIVLPKYTYNNTVKYGGTPMSAQGVVTYWRLDDFYLIVVMDGREYCIYDDYYHSDYIDLVKSKLKNVAKEREEMKRPATIIYHHSGNTDCAGYIADIIFR